MITCRDALSMCSCTTLSQRIKHKDPYVAGEHERLEEYETQSAANHDYTGCGKKAMQDRLFL